MNVEGWMDGWVMTNGWMGECWRNELRVTSNIEENDDDVMKSDHR